MTDQEHIVAESLARIGITLAPHPRTGQGWGWSIGNDKIVRDWQGPFATPERAADAAMEWLLEYAWKGMLCHHSHPAPVDDDPLAPWLRAFEEGIALVE